MDKQALNNLPKLAWQGPTHLICSPQEATTAIAYLMNERIVGLDVEIKPVFVKGETNPPAVVSV